VTTSALRLHGLGVSYGPVAALAGLDLEVGDGEVMALLGSSGSGKSTLLHTVAGFIEPESGLVAIGERVVAGPGVWVAPEDRRVGLVFQGAALWPHLTVLDTVAYPIRRRGSAKAHARREAAALLERLGLSALMDRLPAQLSGGEQQRVGLARALARDPALFLFDEPTAHLDTHLRAVVLEEIARRREALGAAALYATHNETARLTGPAAFVDEAALSGQLTDVLPGPFTEPVNGPTGRLLLVRPDWVRLDGDLPGRVESVRYRGPHTDHVVSLQGGRLLVSSPGPPRRRPGDPVGVTVTRAWPMPGRDGSGHHQAQREKAPTDA